MRFLLSELTLKLKQVHDYLHGQEKQARQLGVELEEETVDKSC